METRSFLSVYYLSGRGTFSVPLLALRYRWGNRIKEILVLPSPPR